MDNISVNVTTHDKHNDITLLTVKGFIAAATADKFDEAFQGVLNSQRYKIVVDLKGVDYVSSTGWGIFIGSIKRIRDQKGDLILVGLNNEVNDVFGLLEFNTIIKTYQDVDEALKIGFGRR